MKPQITVRFLEALGLPPGLLALLGQAWGQQSRYVQFEGHTHEVALAWRRLKVARWRLSSSVCGGVPA